MNVKRFMGMAEDGENFVVYDRMIFEQDVALCARKRRSVKLSP